MKTEASTLINPKAFPYTTKDPELLSSINKVFKEEETPLEERIAKFSPLAQGKLYYVIMVTAQL